MRNTKQHNMARSVRASLTMYQKPWLARNNSGTLCSRDRGRDDDELELQETASRHNFGKFYAKACKLLIKL
jgi:hypothetical protein